MTTRSEDTKENKYHQSIAPKTSSIHTKQPTTNPKTTRTNKHKTSKMITEAITQSSHAHEVVANILFNGTKQPVILVEGSVVIQIYIGGEE
ncbi:predicted protein [Sclerotinia sclerotiorum 1980 UF-70]|uniref:Uncharacterized protein n=1 Tax=Sclerotinia sclerotiorum (strain ATCC 18683 / 1980 / Ss-1) TaxID=665079 RepID=A7EZN4_SCLS1|nr:predicted protein [Sclerotinia sclerotiorum 1980 UF-70]EDN94926.1 predicted protein [Sclerotinia sclerotiorum 1980 UF-70]